MAIDKSSYSRDYMSPKKELKEDEKVDYTSAPHYFKKKLFDKMGIDLDAMTRKGRDAENTLRFYELTAEGELKDPFEDGTELSSNDFLDKMALGKIIGFPSGEKYPVQMQLLGTSPEFSKPLETIPMPKPQEPPKMSRWTRFANWFTRGRAYKQEKAAYDQQFSEYQQKLERWQKNTNAFRTACEARTPEMLRREEQEYQREFDLREETKQRVAQEEEREEARAKVQNMQSEKPVYSIDQYRNTLRECYGATPVFHEEFCGAGKSYTKAEFDVLQDYGKEARDTGITEEQFTALSIFAAFATEIGGKYHPERYPGITQEENARLSVSMFTDTVNFGKVTSRGSHGEVYGIVVQPARAETVKALREYRNGQSDRLAQQIARGMDTLSNHYAGKELERELFLSVTSVMSDALELLEKDKELMAKTREAMKGFAQKDHPEAKPEELEEQVKRSFALAKGQRTALELTRKNEKAKELLNGERLGLCQLTPEEKKQCIDDRVAFEAVNEFTKEDVYFQMNDEKYLAGMSEVQEEMTKATMTGDAELLTHATVKNNTLTENLISAPEAIVMMGADDRTVSAIVKEALPNREGLYQLSGQELINALNAEKLFDRNSPYIQKPKTAEPAVQKAVEKTADKSAEIG